jgi:hypothetical protein
MQQLCHRLQCSSKAKSKAHYVHCNGHSCTLPQLTWIGHVHKMCAACRMVPQASCRCWCPCRAVVLMTFSSLVGCPGIICSKLRTKGHITATAAWPVAAVEPLGLGGTVSRNKAHANVALDVINAMPSLLLVHACGCCWPVAGTAALTMGPSCCATWALASCPRHASFIPWAARVSLPVSCNMLVQDTWHDIAVLFKWILKGETQAL